MEFPTWSIQSTKTDIKVKVKYTERGACENLKCTQIIWKKENTTDWVVWFRLTNHTQLTKTFYKLIVPQLYTQHSTKPVCEADI